MGLWVVNLQAGYPRPKQKRVYPKASRLVLTLNPLFGSPEFWYPIFAKGGEHRVDKNKVHRQREGCNNFNEKNENKVSNFSLFWLTHKM
jgi:hypothetical protein